MTYTCNDCGNACDIIQVPTNDRDIQPDNESECCGAEFEEVDE